MTVLDEAKATVYGDRERDYDHPADNFARIAVMWEVIFGFPVTPQQVALAMVCTKVVREVHRPKRDNRVDIAGYAEALDRTYESR
jgi:uncharacterized protein DUF6378